MGLFRRYANEMGASILLADAAMMACTVLATRGVGRFLSPSDAGFVGAIAAYVGMLVVHSF